jgi:CDP-6-deoxy-D-xylo-4-hexulose-3-dehydrase
MIAHTLGNSFNLEEVQKLCKEYNLWLIEDNCDALGTTYNSKFT